MGKAFVQLSVLVVLFFAVWFGLSRIDYVQHFRLNNISKRAEKKIGEMVMETLERTNKKNDADSVQHVLDKIEKRLGANNSLRGTDIHICLIESSEVNAFALPGDNIVVYTGLINHCDSVSELCGVIAHEMGHIKLNHVMKRLSAELGMGVLSAITSNGKVAGQIIKTLSSSAFERRQESEADAFAVRAMQAAHIDPKGFAGLMTKMADMQSGLPDEMEWISTHPDSKKRAETILILAGQQEEVYEPAINNEEWARLKDAAKGR